MAVLIRCRKVVGVFYGPNGAMNSSGTIYLRAGNKRLHTFAKGIISKMFVRLRLEFELINGHFATVTLKIPK